MTKKLNKKLIKSTISWLDTAPPYLFRSITNKLNIEVVTSDKHDYAVYMDNIEEYCNLSLENTIKVINTINNNVIED